ncbi:MAG: hypothetical protein CMI95_01420 [Pelagibacteraceae bacterium]|nr:hypothetical protein [Pelagibacteraceae bacterium]PPR52149.1 MAG: Alkaline phosphatase synthesis sensor protein PhoR [Alphaproteobacteria bacterium MarineAlpha5_Bin10]
MNNLSNFTLTFQIILINLVIIVISFVFFGLFNFYIISRDYSLEDKKMELANLSAELSDSLVYEAIRTPYFFPIDNKGTFEPLNPYISRIITDLELVKSDKEELDPYTSQSIVEQYSVNFDSDIKIFNTNIYVLVDSNYISVKNPTILSLAEDNISSNSYYDQYENFYINNFLIFWRYFNKNKYKEILVPKFNETVKVAEIIKSQKPIQLFYLDNDDSITFKVMNPLLKNDDIYGVLIVSESLRDLDVAIAELSFNLFNNLIIIILFVILLSSFYARSIASPIKKLSNIANQFKFNQPINISKVSFPERGDEIGQLSKNLQDMSKSLLERIDELERFAGDVSHELKNPLASIKSANEILKKGGQDIESINSLIDIIDKDTVRMDRLITDISNYAKTKAEVDKHQNHDINIISLLNGITETYKNNNKNISLQINDLKGHYVMFGNSTKIAQVICSVLDNSISFTPKNKSIILNCEKIYNYFNIYIVDQGPGIDLRYKEKIFERFYTDRSIDDNFHSGLGLDIARHIIQSYKGKIYLGEKKFEGYNGACFVIELPLKEGH